MPTILLKKSDTASAVPTTANLTNLAGGVEVAVNTADRRMFTMTSASAVVELGNNPTSLNITTGNLAFTGTGQRITGDMSNATIASRLFFQNSVTNGVSVFGVMPNGTATTSRVSVWNASDPANSSWGDISVTSAELQLRSNQVGTGTYLPMTFYTGGSERMRLDTSGNLGIGTASPGTKLEVVVSTNNGLRISDGAVTGVVYASSGPTMVVGTTSNHPTLLYSNNAERMRIDSSGNVGIGKAASTNKLEVSGNISDIAGNVRAIPRTGSEKTSAYTLAITDVGQFVQVGTSGSVTVPNDTFATGDVVSVFNNTTGNISINCPITTAYLSGTNTDRASLTLATRGVATILFINPSLCVASGNLT